MRTPSPVAAPVSERIPDVSERVAERSDGDWEVAPDGRVHVHKSKFGPAGSRMLKAFRVKPTLTVKLDALGSEVWQLLDGRRRVADVLAELRRRHPDEEDLPARLGKFLSTMVSNDLVRLR